MIDKHLIAKTQPIALAENTVFWKDVRVTVLSESLFRVEKDVDKKFCDGATQTVWFRNMPAVDFTAEETDKELVVKTAKATVIVKEDIDESVVQIGVKKVTVGKIKNLPGAYRSLDRCDGDLYYMSRDRGQFHITLEDGIVSADGVGMHDDTVSLILGQDGKLSPREDDDRDIYLFAHGDDYRGALRDLFAISGRVPVIPRYAFGNWWSRYHAYTDKEYLHILDKLASRDIPLTVATIDMDWHWSTTLDRVKKITEQGKADSFHGGANGWTGYSWNTDLFPDYKSFLKKIQDRNLKITLNLHPADGVRYFEDMYEEMANAMGIDPKTEEKVHFDFTSDDFINAYFKILHKPYEKDGVEFWWIDWQQGTKTAMSGLDPLWALNHYHTLDNATDHKPLILSRYCGIGSHRYPLGFSGDTFVTWKSLDYIPYFTAMGTNAGYTWWSHDIGGHMYGYKSDELYARYVQFGAFSPINRLHCSDSSIMTKEPSVYMNGAGLIAEEFLRLRHRMIPYLYSASYETSENGQALIEPMYYVCPNEKDAYAAKGQYMFANQMIVAPVTKAGDKNGLVTTKVWLPEGRWTDIFTGDEYDGGQWVEMTRWMDTIPVLAKEGGFFLLDGRKHTNKSDVPDLIEVMVFNGNGEYTLHEDNEGGWMHTAFKSEKANGMQTLEMLADGNLDVMPERTYKFEFRNIPDGNVRVFADGKPVVFETDIGDYLTVIVENAKAGVKYRVEVEYERTATEYRNARIIYNITRIEGDFEMRRKFKEALFKEDDATCKKYIMQNEAFSKIERKRLCEAW